MLSAQRTQALHPLMTLAAIGSVVFAVAAGAAIGMYGTSVALVLVGLFLGMAGLVAFNSYPITVMLGLWVYEVIALALASLVGYASSRGQLVLQVHDYVIALLLVAVVWRVATGNTKVNHLRLVLPGVVIAGLGLVSDVVHHVSLSVAAIGIWEGIRIWLLLAIVLVIPWKSGDADRIYSVFVRVGMAVALLGAVDFVARAPFRHLLHTDTVSLAVGDYRSSSAVESIFTTPGKFSLCMCLLFCVVLASYVARHRTRDLAYSAVFALAAVLSLRLEAVLSLAVVILIVALFSTRVSGAASLRVLVVSLLVGVVAVTIAGDAVTRQVKTYAGATTTARSLLYTTSERIAGDNFPLGSGFGTFGSSPSRKHYSQVYIDYGLGQVYGLSPEYRQFIDDTSWPSVLGETGYVGFISYVIGLLALAVVLSRRVRASVRPLDAYTSLSALCGLAVIALQSIANPTLFDGFAAVTLGLLAGPASISSVKEGAETRESPVERHRIQLSGSFNSA